ncbi:MAG: hypothetical protein U0235_28630 [Polyangiaceae bacterium]
MTRAVGVALIGLGLLGGACKKNVDPSAFDAGATAAPVVAPVASSAPVVAVASAPAVDSVAPLASLSPPIAAPAPVAAGNAPAKKKANLPECDQARTMCGHPAIKVDKALQALCAQKKDACLSKGGTL